MCFLLYTTHHREHYKDLLLRLREIRRMSEEQTASMSSPLRSGIASPIPGMRGQYYTIITEETYYPLEEEETWSLDAEGGWDVSYTAEAISVMMAMADVDEMQGSLTAAAKKWRAIIRAQEEMYKHTLGNAPAEIAKSMARLACVMVRTYAHI
jgi:hypothetical protein